jgi:hypothetical protein
MRAAADRQQRAFAAVVDLERGVLDLEPLLSVPVFATRRWNAPEQCQPGHVARWDAVAAVDNEAAQRSHGKTCRTAPPPLSSATAFAKP